MCFVDEDVSIDVGRVHPVATEILWQSAARFDNFRLDRSDAQSLRRLFGCLKGIAFGRNRHTDVQIVVTILQKTAILLIFATFLRVCNGEIVIFAHKPIAQATVFDDTSECARHALAHLVRNVEFLIRDQELRTGGLARPNLCVWVIAFTSETETILRNGKYTLIITADSDVVGKGYDSPDMQIAKRLPATNGN